MLKKTAVAFLFCLTGSIANAQINKFSETTKPVVCDDTQKVISVIMERYKEAPVWLALDGEGQSRYVLMTNPKTGSWTLLQYTPDMACILGVGSESNLLSGKNTL